MLGMRDQTNAIAGAEGGYQHRKQPSSSHSKCQPERTFEPGGFITNHSAIKRSFDF
jgi:hypothetical protein